MILTGDEVITSSSISFLLHKNSLYGEPMRDLRKKQNESLADSQTAGKIQPHR
jgi:hypothetical protein